MFCSQVHVYNYIGQHNHSLHIYVNNQIQQLAGGQHFPAIMNIKH